LVLRAHNAQICLCSPGSALDPTGGVNCAPQKLAEFPSGGGSLGNEWIREGRRKNERAGRERRQVAAS